MDLRSFFGILPSRLPYSDETSPPEPLPMPGRIILLWPDRTPADLAPGIGEEVVTGQNLAQNGKGVFLSTATGRVQEISDFKGPDGHDSVAIAIATNPTESFDPSLSAIEDISNVDPSELRSAINRAGFTVLSLISSNPSEWPPVDTMICSALDIDPLSIVNQQAFRDHTGQIEAAIKLLVQATGASRSVLAVPENLADISRNASISTASVVLVPAVYPNGMPEILAKKYGAGFLMRPSDEGIVGNTLVVSVEHAIAMVDCLKTGKPLREKNVTFSSGKKGMLKNFRVRIGAPVGDLLQKAGIEAQQKDKLILNGTMRGYTCFSDEQPITSTTDSLHLQRSSEVFSFQDIACTNCGKCTAICPVDLEVNLLGRFSEYGIFDKCGDLGAEHCIECGLCAFVCPARRPLVQYIVRAKHAIQNGNAMASKVNMEEAMDCDACGPVCPAIRLFDMSEEKDLPEESAGGKSQG